MNPHERVAARRHLLDRFVYEAADSFDSARIAEFLHALVRLHRPQTIVELGRGLGVSALHLALAADENADGHVWSVDDEELVAQLVDLEGPLRWLAQDNISVAPPADARAVVEAIAEALDLADRLTLVRAHIAPDSAEPVAADLLPAQAWDLLFSDFNHGAETVLQVLTWALPRMAPAASIIFDSASTWWPTYLVLEQVVAALSAGRVPELLRGWGPHDLERLVARRRFTLVHLTQPEGRQNGAAWIKIEPIDLVPWPRTQMRSPTSEWPAW